METKCRGDIILTLIKRTCFLLAWMLLVRGRCLISPDMFANVGIHSDSKSNQLIYPGHRGLPDVSLPDCQTCCDIRFFCTNQFLSFQTVQKEDASCRLSRASCGRCLIAWSGLSLGLKHLELWVHASYQTPVGNFWGVHKPKICQKQGSQYHKAHIWDAACVPLRKELSGWFLSHDPGWTHA